ncbi:MAG: hypothetical protein J6T99_08755 [Oscillospiraceae bacterium]|nr:hypothetical protein [Oscillospiraceae bacterium]
MNTLEEVIRYCNEEAYHGALLLTGEMGCGKTYLIEEELAEALQSTHYIVRVSLFGVDSIKALTDEIRKQWLFICTPFLGKLSQRREHMEQNYGLISAISSVLRSFNPTAGNLVSAAASFDPLEYIPLVPEVEDYRNGGEKKKVVLVFDDLDRTTLSMVEIIGHINGFCENKNFRTIIIANEKLILAKLRNNSAENSIMDYRLVKEKTVARTVLYIPDYQKIIHSIIAQESWQSQEYADFLSENEDLIRELFADEPSLQAQKLEKHHNFRSLICALQEFYRVYEVLEEHQVSDTDRYLYSFITYMLISKNGIYKNGITCFDVSEEEIRQLYKKYSSEMMPDSIRKWIEFGIWDEAAIAENIRKRIPYPRNKGK